MMVAVEFSINGLADRLLVAIIRDGGKNFIDKRHVQIEAVLPRIRAAQVNFNVICHAVSDRETFDDVLELFVFVRETRRFGNRDAHAHASPVSRSDLRIHATSHRIDAIVVETHAIMNCTVILDKTDTRSVRISFADMAGCSPDRDASKAHVGKIANAFCRLVCTSREHNRATKMERI